MPNRREQYADMEKFRVTRYNQRKRYYAKTAKYEPRPWSKEEEELVLAHNITDTELSGVIKRSVSAIQHRRCELKKIYKIEK